MQLIDEHPHCVIRVTAKRKPTERLAVVVRPYNPEGISFIETICHGRRSGVTGWSTGRTKSTFKHAPEKCVLSNYKEGDVLHALCGRQRPERNRMPGVDGHGRGAFIPQRPCKDAPLEIRIPIVDELTAHETPTYKSVPKLG